MMPSQPLQIESIEEASEAIARLLVRLEGVQRPVVAIGGPVGSGKSTLARRLGGLVVTTDDYLPDYEGLPELERDEPQRADLPRLASDLDRLRATGLASVPTWCFQTHRRTGERTLVADALIVCEGIFALHPIVTPSADVRVLVVADESTRWKRWERIELDGERGMGVDAARRHFESVAEPTYQRYAGLYEADVHLVVRNQPG